MPMTKNDSATLLARGAMRPENVPMLGLRYWVVISLASIAGCNLGDFVSLYLHLGHWIGLIPLALVLAIVLVCERQLKIQGEGWYWAIIIVVRTAATNLADLATYTFKIDYPWTIGLLAAGMVLVVLPVRPRLITDGKTYVRPSADGWYWGAMLMAGALGTAIGDYFADGLGLGTGISTIILTVALIGTLAFGFRTHWYSKAEYWLAIVAVRSAGTTAGDHLADENGLNLGLLAATILSCGMFIAILLLWRPRPTSAPLRL